MKDFKKPLIGSVVAFFVGTSCCWMSSLAIWFGGMAFFGLFLQWVADFQVQLILLGVVLGVFSVYLYQKKNDKSVMKK